MRRPNRLQSVKGVTVECAEEGPGYWVATIEYRNLICQGEGWTEPGAIAAALSKMGRFIRSNGWHKRSEATNV